MTHPTSPPTRQLTTMHTQEPHHPFTHNSLANARKLSCNARTALVQVASPIAQRRRRPRAHHSPSPKSQKSQFRQMHANTRKLSRSLVNAHTTLAHIASPQSHRNSRPRAHHTKSPKSPKSQFRQMHANTRKLSRSLVNAHTTLAHIASPNPIATAGPAHITPNLVNPKNHSSDKHTQTHANARQTLVNAHPSLAQASPTIHCPFPLRLHAIPETQCVLKLTPQTRTG